METVLSRPRLDLRPQKAGTVPGIETVTNRVNPARRDGPGLDL